MQLLYKEGGGELCVRKTMCFNQKHIIPMSLNKFVTETSELFEFVVEIAFNDVIVLNYCVSLCRFYNLNIISLFSIYPRSYRNCIQTKIQTKYKQDTTHFVILWLFAKQIMAFGYWCITEDIHLKSYW